MDADELDSVPVAVEVEEAGLGAGDDLRDVDPSPGEVLPRPGLEEPAEFAHWDPTLGLRQELELDAGQEGLVHFEVQVVRGGYGWLAWHLRVHRWGKGRAGQ